MFQIETYDTNWKQSALLIENSILIGFLKITNIENQLPVRFCIALKRNKILKVKNPLANTIKSITFNILLHIKISLNLIQELYFRSEKHKLNPYLYF